MNVYSTLFFYYISICMPHMVKFIEILASLIILTQSCLYSIPSTSPNLSIFSLSKKKKKKLSIFYDTQPCLFPVMKTFHISHHYLVGPS